MKIAMYKGPAEKLVQSITHNAICIWTCSAYSHAELVFGEPDNEGKSLCASSSSRDGGVRFKNINLGSGRWDVFELIGFDLRQEADAYAWFSANRGAHYDYLGLVWFVLPFGQFGQPTKFVCSEAIAEALGFTVAYKYHPQKLFDALFTKLI